MKFSSLGGKEIVNLWDGSRLGVVSDTDLLINEETGKIIALLIPYDKGLFRLLSNTSFLEIPWKAIKKIGNDIIIIELKDSGIKKHTL